MRLPVHIACTVLAALAAACAGTPMQSVPDEAAGRGYQVGMTLVLMADRMLEKPPGTLSGPPPNLVRESLRTTGRNLQIEHYRRDRAAFPGILGIVPKGTRLVVTTLGRHTYPGLEAWF